MFGSLFILTLTLPRFEVEWSCGVYNLSSNYTLDGSPKGRARQRARAAMHCMIVLLL